MNTIPQLQRRHEAKLRLPPLNSPDERLQEITQIRVNPYKTLRMIRMGVSFTIPLDDLRAAWMIAGPEDRDRIEYIAEQLQPKEKELVA